MNIKKEIKVDESWYKSKNRTILVSKDMETGEFILTVAAEINDER